MIAVVGLLLTTGCGEETATVGGRLIDVPANAQMQISRDTLTPAPTEPDTPSGSGVLDASWNPSVEIRQTPSVGRGGIEGIICAYPWPQGCDYWIAVAFCESSLSPDAVGYMGRYVGLFQVWLGHGYSGLWLQDPFNNTFAAWELSDEGKNTRPWPYCRWQ